MEWEFINPNWLSLEVELAPSNGIWNHHIFAPLICRHYYLPANNTSRQKLVCLSPNSHHHRRAESTRRWQGSAQCYIMVFNKHTSRVNMAACLLLGAAASAFQAPPSILLTRQTTLRTNAINITALHGKLWKRLQIEEGE